MVSFGGFCSGVVVSPDGLVLTNHHCGFSSIQQLSSLEHDYLQDGFVAKDRSQELPCPDLYVRFMLRQEDVTRRVLSDEHFRPTLFNMPLSFAANSLRSRLLRHWMATRYGRRIDHLRGCNMAFWRDDLIRVNGFNEDLTQWGHEDGEIAFRLHFAGVGKKSLKMGGCVYHLYHPEASRSGEQRHLDELERVKQGRISRCDNGIDKYLKQ